MLSNSLFSLVTQWKYVPLTEYFFFFLFILTTLHNSSPVTNGDCTTLLGEAATTIFLSEVLHATLQIENTICTSTSLWRLYGSLAGLSLGKEELLGLDLFWISLFSTTSNGNWQGYISAFSNSLFPGGITNFTLSVDSDSPYFITQVVSTVLYTNYNGMISFSNLIIDFDPAALRSNDGMLLVTLLQFLTCNHISGNHLASGSGALILNDISNRNIIDGGQSTIAITISFLPIV